MHLVACSLGSLVVAMLYYAYRDHARQKDQHQRNLRERVAYMLWVTAMHTN